MISTDEFVPHKQVGKTPELVVGNIGRGCGQALDGVGLLYWSLPGCVGVAGGVGGGGRKRRGCGESVSWGRGVRFGEGGEGSAGLCTTDMRAMGGLGEDTADVRGMSKRPQTRPKFGLGMGQSRPQNEHRAVCLAALGCGFLATQTETDTS